jgi:hypothetical protein
VKEAYFGHQAAEKVLLRCRSLVSHCAQTRPFLASHEVANGCAWWSCRQSPQNGGLARPCFNTKKRGEASKARAVEAAMRRNSIHAIDRH